ncbi:hypothetical protein [Ornithinimicrobium faecis]|uniref:hypothetical protein n=1 Tax=Ornithinimicrobium faecis TaxID=2934158 RepID=UPI002118F010|nr:hypothetical protein [Ornithinimicrobium sp. HY1745]
MTPSAARLPLVVAVMVTGSLLVSPLLPAVSASVLCWLAVLGSRPAPFAVLTGGSRGAREMPGQELQHGHSHGNRWPEELRAVLTGLLLTLAVLGASWALLQQSGEALLTALVLCASTIPWWWPAAERTLGEGTGRSAVLGAGQEARADADADLMRWHSRRRVASMTLAATLGVTGTLALMGLLVISDGTVLAGAGAAGGRLSQVTGCHLTGANFVPICATTSTVAGAAAAVAIAAAPRMRPAPQPGSWQLAAWCAVGAVLTGGGVIALSAWWVC